MAMQYYGLDPTHYLTLPHFAWDAMLKKTRVKIDLLTDIEMYNMVEKGKRGGMVQVTKRYAKATNQFTQITVTNDNKKWTQVKINRIGVITSSILTVITCTVGL